MNTIRKLLQPVAGLLSTHQWIQLTGQKVFCPFYHTVSNLRLPYIAPYYKVRNEKEFEADLDFLLQHFAAIDWKELAAIANGKSVTKPVFFLSFDDGLRELREVVAPVLLRKGVPATFFINPDFILNKTWMFRYKAALLHQRMSAGGGESAVLKNPLHFTYQQQHLLDEAALKLNLDWEEEWKRWKPYLSIDDLRSLNRDGFTIGTHGLRHQHFSELNYLSQQYNIAASHSVLTDMDLDVAPLFSFPFGDDGIKREFFDNCYNNLQLQLTFGTAGLKQDVEARHIQRFPVENFTAPLQRSTAAEYFYYLLKKPLGKNRIVRL